jgi:hypothetical protein
MEYISVIVGPGAENPVVVGPEVAGYFFIVK